jgi:membrane-bound lytic murein transglycosylase D
MIQLRILSNAMSASLLSAFCLLGCAHLPQTKTVLDSNDFHLKNEISSELSAAALPVEKPVEKKDESALRITAMLEEELAPSETKASAVLPMSGGQARDSLKAKTKTKTASFAPPPTFDAEKSSEPGASLTEAPSLKKLGMLETSAMQFSGSTETPLIFDIPVTYNHRVSNWIRYFQNEGRGSFRIWLERSARFLPVIEGELSKAGLPKDLGYLVMIESGFNPQASSHAGAMGLWQFISPTGARYGLKIDWWIDERRDFSKSTAAAISYMTDLYDQFRSWYLVAASYNMGENGVRRLIAKHGTNNFWELADRGALPRETTDYVPKILAAMLISKAPALYGFRDLSYYMPMAFESMTVPGGVDLPNLANYLGVSEKYLQDLNPELIKGFIPKNVRGHSIRVPKGSMLMVSQFVRMQANGEAAN